MPNPEKDHELEEFRLKYERYHEAAEPGKLYTSKWPAKHQQWLFENDPQTWFDGLPPFVKAFFKEKIEAAANGGELGGTPGNWIANYLEGRVRAPLENPRSR